MPVAVRHGYALGPHGRQGRDSRPNGSKGCGSATNQHFPLQKASQRVGFKATAGSVFEAPAMAIAGKAFESLNAPIRHAPPDFHRQSLDSFAIALELAGFGQACGVPSLRTNAFKVCGTDRKIQVALVRGQGPPDADVHPSLFPPAIRLTLIEGGYVSFGLSDSTGSHEAVRHRSDSCIMGGDPPATAWAV